MNRILTVALLLLVPAVAFAVGGEHGAEAAGHAAEAAHGAAHGGGHGAIPWKEMAFHGVNLLILLGVVGWAAKGPVTDALRNRSLAVKRDLEESHQLRKEAQDRFDELESKLAHFEQRLEEMKSEATSEARAEAERIREKTTEEVAWLGEVAEKTIRDEVVHARTSLQREAVELAIQLAEENLKSRISAQDQENMARDLLGAVKDEVTHG
jgi:F-type H+-transporting ATPase subunit b